VLAPVLARFTEGRDAPDVVAAREWLEELENVGRPRGAGHG
jgi:hypothetical protein